MRLSLGEYWPVWLTTAALVVIGTVFGVSYLWESTALGVLFSIAYAVDGLLIGAFVFVRPKRSDLGTQLFLLAWAATLVFTITLVVKELTNPDDPFAYARWFSLPGAFAGGASLLAFVTRRLPRRPTLELAVGLGLASVVMIALAGADAIGHGPGAEVVNSLRTPVALAAVTLAIAASSL